MIPFGRRRDLSNSERDWVWVAQSPLNSLAELLVFSTFPGLLTYNHTRAGSVPTDSACVCPILPVHRWGSSIQWMKLYAHYVLQYNSVDTKVDTFISIGLTTISLSFSIGSKLIGWEQRVSIIVTSENSISISGQNSRAFKTHQQLEDII